MDFIHAEQTRRPNCTKSSVTKNPPPCEINMHIEYRSGDEGWQEFLFQDEEVSFSSLDDAISLCQALDSCPTLLLYYWRVVDETGDVKY